MRQSAPIDSLIRPIGPGDHDFALGLGARVFGWLSRDAVATMRSILDEPCTEAAVAELPDGPVGLVVVRFDRHERDVAVWTRPLLAHLNAIAVEPEWFGRGIGHRLLAHAEDMATERGALSLSLMTAESNARARALFRARGFAVVAPLGPSYGRGQSAIAMWKALRPTLEKSSR